MAKRKRSQAYIKKTIEDGTPEERAMLVANSCSERVFGNKGFLTREQIEALAQGVKTQAGLKTYKQILDYEYHIRTIIPFLSNIDPTLEKIDLKVKCIELDIELELSKQSNRDHLTEQIVAAKKEIENAKHEILPVMTDLKTMIKAIRNFMKEEKLKIDAYEEYLNSKEEKWEQFQAISDYKKICINKDLYESYKRSLRGIDYEGLEQFKKTQKLVRYPAHMHNQFINPVTDDKQGNQLPLWDVMGIRSESTRKVMQTESYVLGLDLNVRQTKALFAVIKIFDGTGYIKDKAGKIVSYKGNVPYKRLEAYESPDRIEHKIIPSVSITLPEYYDAYGVTKRRTKRGWNERNSNECKEALKALRELSEIKPVIVYKRRYFNEKGEERIDRIERAPVPIVKVDKAWQDITLEEDKELDQGNNTKAPTHFQIQADPIMIDQLDKYYLLKPVDFYELINLYSEGPKTSEYVTLFMEWVHKTATDIYRSRKNNWNHEIGSLLLAKKLRMESTIKKRNWERIKKWLQQGVTVSQKMGYIKKHERVEGVSFKESKEIFYFNPEKFK